MRRASTVFEVDQSIKIGDLSADTILAFSNHSWCTVRIPAQAKKELLFALRGRGKSTIRATVQLFAAALFLLLKDVVGHAALIIIDTEYTGYEGDIRGMLFGHFRAAGVDLRSDQVAFRPVGKSSGAHARAIAVHRGCEAPSRTITASELGQVLRVS